MLTRAVMAVRREQRRDARKPYIKLRELRKNASEKQRAVLAAVRRGAHSYPAIVRATGLKQSEAINCVRRLREQGLLAFPLPSHKHGQIRLPGTELERVWR